LSTNRLNQEIFKVYREYYLSLILNIYKLKLYSQINMHTSLDPIFNTLRYISIHINIVKMPFKLLFEKLGVNLKTLSEPNTMFDIFKKINSYPTCLEINGRASQEDFLKSLYPYYFNNFPPNIGRVLGFDKGKLVEHNNIPYNSFVGLYNDVNLFLKFDKNIFLPYQNRILDLYDSYKFNIDHHNTLYSQIVDLGDKCTKNNIDYYKEICCKIYTEESDLNLIQNQISINEFELKYLKDDFFNL
jgi:hypothetical protein